MRKRILQISAAMCMVLFAVCALPMRVYAARAYDQQTVLDIATNGMGNYQECGPFTVEINGKKDWKNLCLGFVNSCFNKAYGIVAGNEEACCAYHYGSLYIDSTSRDNIPIGADVFFDGSSVWCGGCNHSAGHIGIYVGNGLVVHSWDNYRDPPGIFISTIDYIVRCGYPYRGYGWHGNVELTTGYISGCESYPSYATLEVTKQTPMHSLPCSDLTDSSSERICTWPVGKRLTATGLYRNTAGNYWYGVTDPDSGKEGYVFAGEVRVKELLWDATITGADYPEELSLGSRFWIKGTVSTRYTGLQTVTGSILKNGTVRYTCSVNTTSAFSLLNSKIDDALCFNELEAGGYNYLVSAKCRNYYATDGTTLASPEMKTITVHSNYFSVGGHVHAYTIEEYEAAHPHRCYKRCSCGDYQYTGETAYVDTCEECTKYSGTCGADGDNLTWKLNRDTGELTISGSGYMKDYDGASKTPWYGVRDEIKTVTIGSGVMDVGAYAFSGCGSLTGVTLPDSLTEIRRRAFQWCENLSEITIPENVTLIGEYAFWGTGLSGITVPRKVSSIGKAAFTSLNMKTILVDAGNQYYVSEEGVLYNKDKTLLHTYPSGKNNWVESEWGSKDYFRIPDTVTEIEDYAFQKCKLSEIHMGHSIKTIGASAFENCDNLQTILLPASVSNIKYSAFADSGLKAVYCEGSAPESFGKAIFNRCVSNLIFYCKEDIGDWRTVASGKGSVINVFDTAASISNTYRLKEMLGLGECGMYDSDQLIWTLDPDGTLNISGSWRMKDYSANNRAPWYDLRDKIKTVTFGAEVATVGDEAFADCSSLRQIVFSDIMEELGSCAFDRCTSLQEITIPKNVDSIAAYTFAECKSLRQISVSSGNAEYTSVDGVLFNKDQTKLYCYPAGKTDTSYAIPGSVTSIYSGAFSSCASLTRVDISAKVTSIGFQSFYECEALKEIHIPASVTTIANDSFANCKSLSAVYFEGNAPSACSAAAFNNCASSFTIYYNPGTTGWTDSSAYDASAGTWNGYRLKSTQEPEPSEPGEDIPENAVLISAEEIAASAGREVRIMLKLSNNPGINSLRLKIAYDPGVFTLVSASDQGIFGRAPTSSKNITVNPYTMVWASDGNTMENGGLVELVFRVSETAEVGTKRIALTAEQVFNQAEEVVAVAAKDISVNVRKFAPGDANGDGEIDLRDATRLLQYFADWDVTVEKDAADVNGDGEIDLRDATRLLQYLAGWDVSLAQ